MAVCICISEDDANDWCLSNSGFDILANAVSSRNCDDRDIVEAIDVISATHGVFLNSYASETPELCRKVVTAMKNEAYRLASEEEPIPDRFADSAAELRARFAELVEFLEAYERRAWSPSGHGGGK